MQPIEIFIYILGACYIIMLLCLLGMSLKFLFSKNSFKYKLFKLLGLLPFIIIAICLLPVIYTLNNETSVGYENKYNLLLSATTNESKKYLYPLLDKKWTPTDFSIISDTIRSIEKDHSTKKDAQIIQEFKKNIN